MLAGYSKKKRNRAVFFVMGLLAGFVSGFCIKTINPVPDILPHAEGVIYGLMRAGRKGKDIGFDGCEGMEGDLRRKGSCKRHL